MPLSGSNPEIDALLRTAGIGVRTIEAVSQLDAVLQNWRRRMSRRELGNRALHDLGVGIDLAQFDVLIAIAAPASEFGESARDETMVATVAERLSIDPSRASRVVSEMVEAGYARRAVSQADARRTVIELTAAGEAVIAAVRAYKYLILGSFLSEWSDEELASFMPLLEKLSRWSDRTATAATRFSAEIATLSANIKASHGEKVKG